MSRLRRALRVLTSLWICCQAATLAAAPVALGLGAPSAISAAVECTCARGDHAGCPMHRRAPPQGSKATCSCKSTADPATAIVIAIVGPNAVVPRSVPFEPPRSTSALNGESARPLPTTVVSPDGPPPRA